MSSVMDILSNSPLAIRFAAGFAFPNGIVLTADRRRLYVGESGRNRILVWDLAAPGRPAGAFRVFADLPAPDPLFAIPPPESLTGTSIFGPSQTKAIASMRKWAATDGQIDPKRTTGYASSAPSTAARSIPLRP